VYTDTCMLEEFLESLLRQYLPQYSDLVVDPDDPTPFKKARRPPDP